MLYNTRGREGVNVNKMLYSTRGREGVRAMYVYINIPRTIKPFCVYTYIYIPYTYIYTKGLCLIVTTLGLLLTLTKNGKRLKCGGVYGGERGVVGSMGWTAVMEGGELYVTVNKEAMHEIKFQTNKQTPANPRPNHEMFHRMS